MVVVFGARQDDNLVVGQSQQRLEQERSEKASSPGQQHPPAALGTGRLRADIDRQACVCAHLPRLIRVDRRLSREVEPARQLGDRSGPP